MAFLGTLIFASAASAQLVNVSSAAELTNAILTAPGGTTIVLASDITLPGDLPVGYEFRAATGETRHSPDFRGRFR